MDNPELDLFTFFERTPDLVCIASKEGFFVNINPAVINTLEYTREELLAHPISYFIHKEDKDLTSSRRANLLKDTTLLNFQNRYMSKTGKVVWLEWSSIYLIDKGVVFAIAKNITPRKILEQELEQQYHKFKGLASHFKSTIEEDRKFIAAELHDELAQLASAVKVDLDWLSTSGLATTPAITSRIDHALAVSELLVNAIRRISFAISPNMLGDLGLNATLEWHCNEFSLLNRIPCVIKMDYDEADLNSEMKLDFFRVCQESLDNIKLHAKASKVGITIKEKKENIILTIVDNGLGFDINQMKLSAGLVEMRERAASINGSLTIKTSPGKGTTVSLTVPKHISATSL